MGWDKKISGCRCGIATLINDAMCLSSMVCSSLKMSLHYIQEPPSFMTTQVNVTPKKNGTPDYKLQPTNGSNYANLKERKRLDPKYTHCQ